MAERPKKLRKWLTLIIGVALLFGVGLFSYISKPLHEIPPGGVLFDTEEDTTTYLAPPTTTRLQLENWATTVTGAQTIARTSDGVTETYGGGGMTVNLMSRRAIQNAFMGEKPGNEIGEWVIEVKREPSWPKRIWRKIQSLFGIDGVTY